MAGHRQHHIPQALLRGFSTATGKRSNVWLYRKGSEGPINTNIKNVGLSIDFYTHGDDDALDREMTRLESEYGAVLAALRNGNPPTEPNLAVLKRFMANCLVRTARVRTMLGNAGLAAREFLRRISQDTPLLRDGFEAVLNDEEHMMEELRQGIRDIGKPVPSDAILRPLLRNKAAEVLGNLHQHVQQMVARTRHGFDQAVAKTPLGDAQAMHLQALEKSGLEPGRRRAYIESQPFGIAHMSGERLLLGDSIVIGIDHTGAAVDSLSPTDELRGWVMPLSSTYFIYSGPDSLGKMAPEMINDASIGLSNQFFIAKDRSETLAAKITDVGNLPNFLDKIPWSDIYAELVRSARAGELHKRSRKTQELEGK